MSGTTWIKTGALLGFFAVAIGAFGAHGLRERMEGLGTTATFKTGVDYHMFHVTAILGLGLFLLTRTSQPGTASTVAGGSFVLGILLFSGSLYALAITGIKVLGAITPFGGVAFLVGWVAFGFVASSPTPALPQPHVHSTVFDDADLAGDTRFIVEKNR